MPETKHRPVKEVVGEILGCLYTTPDGPCLPPNDVARIITADRREAQAQALEDAGAYFSNGADSDMLFDRAEEIRRAK